MVCHDNFLIDMVGNGDLFYELLHSNRRKKETEVEKTSFLLIMNS
jgi:hypothetical protein